MYCSSSRNGANKYFNFFILDSKGKTKLNLSQLYYKVNVDIFSYKQQML